MLFSSFYQNSMVGVCPDDLELAEDAFERHLPELVRRVVQVDDFSDLHPGAMGAPSCCPFMLTSMLLLQFRYNLSDRELIDRCIRDLGFRYALGLTGAQKPPRISSFRRFRGWLREHKGPAWLFRLSLDHARGASLIGDAGLQAVDSTDTECRGAVIDTFNLVAVGIGRVVRVVARCLDFDPAALAEKWGLSRYLARSVKGAAAIDWSSESARNKLLTAEIADADRLPELVRGLAVKLPPNVSEALELLHKVARQDVEELSDGTFRIARGTAPGRTVSLTDPEARHGRKSAAQAIIGYKLHVTGTIASQFVTGVVVTDASVHDSRPTPQLIGRTAEAGLKPNELIGDGAYGTGANRKACRDLDVQLRAKLPAPSHKGLGKRDFRVDLEAMTVTCPAGTTVAKHSMVKDPGGSTERVPQFRFPTAVCRACPLRAACGSVTAGGRGRLLTLNRYEHEMQDAQAHNATPEAKITLRKRSAVERLLSHLVRLGMRHARFFGMHMVEFQAYLTTAAYNFQRYITLSAAA